MDVGARRWMGVVGMVVAALFGQGVTKAAAPAVGVVTELAVPTGGSAPQGITAGPDGALWFTELDGNRIGRITPNGTITDFPVPPPGSNPVGITAGPDGGLWFLEQSSNRIGQLAPSVVLRVSRSGSGGGTVTSEQEGIACGVDCTEEYFGGTEVTLTAVPAPGSTVGG